MKIKQIILFSIILLFSGWVKAQGKNEISVSLNYILIPHNIIQGAGYSFGYSKPLTKTFSIEGEFAYSMAMRERENNKVYNNYQLLPLYYNHAGYYVSVFPEYNFNLPGQLSFEIGAGITGCYQSYLYDTFHYEYAFEEYETTEDEQNGVYFNEGYFIGALVKGKIKCQLSGIFAVFLQADYKLYWQAENLFSAGLGVSYSF